MTLHNILSTLSSLDEAEDVINFFIGVVTLSKVALIAVLLPALVLVGRFIHLRRSFSIVTSPKKRRRCSKKIKEQRVQSSQVERSETVLGSLEEHDARTSALTEDIPTLINRRAGHESPNTAVLYAPDRIADAQLAQLLAKLATAEKKASDTEEKCLEKDLFIARMYGQLNAVQSEIDRLAAVETSSQSVDNAEVTLLNESLGTIQGDLEKTLRAVKERDALIGDLTVRVTTVGDAVLQAEKRCADRDGTIADLKHAVEEAFQLIVDKDRLLKEHETRLGTIVAGYEDQLDRLKHDNIMLQTQKEMLRDKVTSMKLEGAAKENEHQAGVDRLQRLISDSKDDVKAQQALHAQKEADLKRALDASAHTLSEVQSDLAFAKLTHNLQKAGLEVQIRCLEREAATLKGHIAAKDDELATLARAGLNDASVASGHEFEELTERKDSLEAQLKAKSDELATVTASRLALSKELEAVYGSIESQRMEDEFARRALHGRVGQLESNLARAYIEGQQRELILTEQIETLDDELGSVRDGARQREHDLRGQVKQLECERVVEQTRARQDECDLRAQIVKLETDLVVEKAQRIHCEVNLKNQVADLEAKLAAANARNRQHELDVSDLKEKNAALDEANRTSDAALASAQAKLRDSGAGMQVNVHELQTRVVRLQDKVASRKEQRRMHATQLGQAQGELELAHRDTAERQAQVDTLERQLACATQEPVCEQPETMTKVVMVGQRAASFRRLTRDLQRKMAMIRTRHASDENAFEDVAEGALQVQGRVPGLQSTPYDPVLVLEGCQEPDWMARDSSDLSDILMHASNLDLSEGVVLFGPIALPSGTIRVPLESIANVQAAGPSDKAVRSSKGERDDTLFAKAKKAGSKGKRKEPG